MKRALSTVAALAAAQALLVGAWYAVERARAPGDAPAAGGPVAAARTTPMSRPAPDLELRRPGGEVLRLGQARGRPLILHFWATWCPPCREELPGLLAYAAEGHLPVLAVSVDPDWGAVGRFLGADPPPAVALADGRAVEAALEVRSLPVTFVIDPGGTLRLRLDGPRDWASAATREAVLEAAGR